jgi:hypothetical protein
MKFIEPLVSTFSAPFKRSEEYKLLASAIDSIAAGDKPWMMERVVNSLPKAMSKYEQRKLRKMVEAHGTVIEARIYRQALCRFALGEDLDMEKEARNAASLGEIADRNNAHQQAIQAKLNAIAGQQQAYIQQHAANYQGMQNAAAYAGQNMAAAQHAAQQNHNHQTQNRVLGGVHIPWEQIEDRMNRP